MKQGVFWAVPTGGGVELICRFDDTRGHSEIWETVVAERPAWKKYGYEHFPRGRVWQNGDGATIFLDPKLQRQEILDEIAKKFRLETYKVVSDGTE